MKMLTNKLFQNAVSLLVYTTQLFVQVLADTQFASHISVNTPARSFTHGVGDPVSSSGRQRYNRPSSYNYSPMIMAHTHGNGYPRTKPTVPFAHEDNLHKNPNHVFPWQLNNNIDIAIPILPLSPYRVDSPDPESLWPEGLYLPPINTPKFNANRRSNVETEIMDPYLLEGSEAIAAVQSANQHGLLYFHEIPHIELLLENQNLRIKNNLKPHRIGSIRHTWPFNRI